MFLSPCFELVIMRSYYVHFNTHRNGLALVFSPEHNYQPRLFGKSSGQSVFSTCSFPWSGKEEHWKSSYTQWFWEWNRGNCLRSGDGWKKDDLLGKRRIESWKVDEGGDLQSPQLNRPIVRHPNPVTKLPNRAIPFLYPTSFLGNCRLCRPVVGLYSRWSWCSRGRLYHYEHGQCW